jgi:formylglycine-generating enzyme required for sulfatase activity
MASGMGHIFISYSHKDKDYVHRLYDALQAEGFEVWIDDRIHYGSEWPKVVTRNLDISDGVIVVLSNNSYESDMVQNEVTRAREKKKQIFPLLLDGENWLIVQAKQFVDVRDNSLPTENFYKRLASVTPRNKPISSPAPPLPREESKPPKPVVKPVPAVNKIEEEQKTSTPKFEFQFLDIVAIVLIVLIVLFFGVSYGLAHLPATPKPSPTAQATSAFELPTETPEPPTETSTATLVPTPTPGIGLTMISPQDSMTLDYVPAGYFLMGSTNADTLANSDEFPQHTVYLDAFWIDQTDVTNAMYAKCARAGVCKQPTNLSSYTRSNYYGNSQFDNYPVIYVTWNMADTYCKWAGSQLPTEAQWEKAASWDDKTKTQLVYPWGNDAPKSNLLNYNNNVGDTTEVGKYPNGTSPYGVLDMAGNVWQWVADWYDSGYYANSLSSNPLGTDSGQYLVLRGGSWSSDYNYVRSAYRGWNDPAGWNYGIGFRCSRSQ